MPFATLMSLVTRPWRARRGIVRPQEPADLGTAFGMECWLDEQDNAGPSATAVPPIDKPARLARWWPMRGRGARAPASAVSDRAAHCTVQSKSSLTSTILD